jgi:ribosomal-protein-alanine N-acetyltransferase
MTPKPFKGLPIIETDRLILRDLRFEDADAYFHYHNLDAALEYYDWRPNSLDEAIESIRSIRADYEEQKYLHFAITLKESDQLIGDCGIFFADHKGEINYMLDPTYWGKGYMKEALTGLMSLCFKEADVYRIQAMTLPDNDASRSMLTSLNFTCEGTLRKYGFNALKNDYIDLLMWSLLKSEFEDKAKPKEKEEDLPRRKS